MSSDRNGTKDSLASFASLDSLQAMKPDRRDVLRGGLGVSAWLCSAGRRRAAPSGRPNLLVICSDQQHFQAAGHVDPFFATPALDRLASDALRFELAFCSSPQCSPSRSSMLTGLYPHKTGMMNNANQQGSSFSMSTVGSMLRAAGYHTGYFGKWHLGGDPAPKQGWEELALEVKDGAVTKRGIEFLRARAAGETPFALFLMYLDPHEVTGFEPGKTALGGLDVPLDRSFAEERFENKPIVQKHYMEYDEGSVVWGEPEGVWKEFRAFYRECVRAFDEQLGIVLAALGELGLLERTAVFVTSDHGEMDTHHRLILKGPFLYEHVVRIPLLVRLPESFGGRGPGVEREHAWVNVDLTPTLLELAGAEARACDGRSALPLLRGAAGFEPRKSVVAEYYGKNRWIAPIRMLRTERYKYNLYREFGEELYDLERDPLELENLAAQESAAAVKAGLRAELERWMKENADPFDTFEVSRLRTPAGRR